MMINIFYTGLIIFIFCVAYFFLVDDRQTKKVLNFIATIALIAMPIGLIGHIWGF